MILRVAGFCELVGIIAVVFFIEIGDVQCPGSQGCSERNGRAAAVAAVDVGTAAVTGRVLLSASYKIVID